MKCGWVIYSTIRAIGADACILADGEELDA